MKSERYLLNYLGSGFGVDTAYPKVWTRHIEVVMVRWLLWRGGGVVLSGEVVAVVRWRWWLGGCSGGDDVVRVNERQMHTIEEQVDTSKALDASLVNIKSNETESKEQDSSSRSGNDAHTDDADIRPIYNEEPMAKVDQNAKQCHDTCPLPTKLTDNQTTELSNQSLESEKICLKKTVAQFQEYFAKLEAHCINLELQMENNVLKSGQQSQFLKEKSNEAKVKHDIDVIETINIELEHKMAKLLKENETLKKHYKELFYSIKIIRAKTIEHTTSLITKNDEFKAQLQEKGFAIATLKNELRKLTRNITTHYLPKEREPATAKSHHMIAPSSSRYSSNDIVHNDYLEEAKKKTKESVPTRRIFTSSTTKVDSESPKGSNEDITNPYECEQTLDGFKEFWSDEQAMTFDHNNSVLAPQQQEMSVDNVSSDLVSQEKKASDYDNFDLVPPLQNVVPSADKSDSSQQELEFLFSPLFEEYYTPTHVNAEENNNDQATNASFPQDEFINPFCTPI
ncbi:hypothetical protein Tco_0599653 [Tanacetum coccineum]